METQQLQLIQALKDISRHVQQPVGQQDMREILETVKKCGFDFEGVETQSFPENQDPTAANNIYVERLNEHHNSGMEAAYHAKKRKRGISKSEAGLMSGVSGFNGGSENIDNEVQMNAQPVHELSKGHGNLAWGDSNLSSHSFVPPTVAQSAMPFSSQSDTWVDPQYSNMEGWGLDPHFQASHIAPENILPSSDLEIYPQNQDWTPLDTSNPSDWDSTMWWDPSLLLDPSFGHISDMA